MGACPDLPWVDLEDLALDGGIVQQAQRVVATIDELVKVRLIQAHTNSDGAHDLDMDGLALVMKSQHCGAKARDFWRSCLVGPLISKAGLIFTANLKALLDVRVALFELGDLVDVGELGDLLAAGC